MTLEMQVLALYMHTYFTCGYLAETDVHQAFRILPVAPQDYELLCFIGRKSITLIVVCQWAVELQRNL
jgi:hypothetical protein